MLACLRLKAPLMHKIKRQQPPPPSIHIRCTQENVTSWHSLSPQLQNESGTLVLERSKSGFLPTFPRIVGESSKNITFTFKNSDGGSFFITTDVKGLSCERGARNRSCHLSYRGNQFSSVVRCFSFVCINDSSKFFSALGLNTSSVPWIW